MFNVDRDVDAQRIEESIQLLNQYLSDEDIGPLVSLLESLAADPQNKTLLGELSDVFGSLGFLQGAVLTYAPYIANILPDNLFDDPK